MQPYSLPLFALGLVICLTSCQPTQAPPSGPLADTWESHGGLNTWRSFATLSYTLNMTFKGQSLTDRQTFDLIDRDGLIEGSDYVIGADQGKVWSNQATPGVPPMPPRFYLWTPFYFFGLPFLLADEGVNLEKLPDEMFEGQNYHVLRATFKEGVGDAPDDYYDLLIDPVTSQLRASRYIVTYFKPEPGQEAKAPSVSIILYDEWQKVEGVLLPEKTRLGYWNDGAPVIKGTLDFTNVELSTDRPEAELFKMRGGAQLHPLP